MTASTTNTISMFGNSTGFGGSTGADFFTLAGYYNTVRMAGANDTVKIASGLFDSIDLNSTGFVGPVTDMIDLGTSAFDQIVSSHALSGANLSITGAGGPNTISLINHGGSTAISLGYEGDPALQGTALGNAITLNGDAANTVAFTAGGAATLKIGTAGDNFVNYASNVTMIGDGNSLAGGDEAFTVLNATSTANAVSLGNGANTVSLSGNGNSVVLGNGNNVMALSGGQNLAVLGTGGNTLNISAGGASLTFAAGGAGAQDTIDIHGAVVKIHGGDENFTINGATHGSYFVGSLGNGNNTIALAHDNARLVLGSSVANTAHNSVTLGDGTLNGIFNGGVDTVVTNNAHANMSDKVTLNATLLGTQLTTGGVFDSVTLTNDANAVINDNSLNGGLNITLDGDAHQDFGTIAITGLSHDDLARIHLVNAGAYTVTTDTTAVGGITLHFAHGTINLVGLQSVPNHLFG